MKTYFEIFNEDKKKSNSYYKKEDFSLLVSIYRDDELHKESVSFVNDELEASVSYGTFEIFFKGPELKISSIEAYTNIEMWKASEVILPEKLLNGDLKICGIDRDDTVSLGLDPLYTYDTSSKRLHVKLSTDEAEQNVQIAPHLIIGLYKNGLTDIYILDLKFE